MNTICGEGIETRIRKVIETCSYRSGAARRELQGAWLTQGISQSQHTSTLAITAIAIERAVEGIVACQADGKVSAIGHQTTRYSGIIECQNTTIFVVTDACAHDGRCITGCQLCIIEEHTFVGGSLCPCAYRQEQSDKAQEKIPDTYG